MASYDDYRYHCHCHSSPPAKRRALAPMDANAKTATTMSPKPFGLYDGKPTTPSRLAPRKAPRHPHTPHSRSHPHSHSRPLSHSDGPGSGLTLAGSPIKRAAPEVPRHSTSPSPPPPPRSSVQQQEYDQERDQNTFQLSDTRSPSPEASSLFDAAPDPNGDDTCYHDDDGDDGNTSSHPHRHLPPPPPQPRAANTDEAAVTRDQARRIRARLRLAMYKVRTSQADKTLGQLELRDEDEDEEDDDDDDDEESGTWEAAEKGVRGLRGDLRV
ncbi:hypothetical protein N3K66_001848 [Trichothecium roseum]|uniref:Uncharacterized protein n=1 Tax=Trichothecium roseum TaxID=47278 RepID=A0ACC0V9D2_9HYPO|nr:hypothetical protein N3K66_001848 [Trichothecium roseum]